MAVITEHPYFGSGFGTSTTNAEESAPSATYSSSAKSTREHGNSYLAIAEWVGLLGLAPFLVLLSLLSANIFRVLRWIRRTAVVNHISVPLTIVLIAGLIHSGFEDWLFAVGYYLSVFFWTFAFVLADEMPPAFKPLSTVLRSQTSTAANSALGVPASTR
jgi:O-antigen ligase